MSYSFSSLSWDNLVNKNEILNAMLHLYIYLNGVRKQNAESTYNLRIPHTVCGFSLQLRMSQQLNLTVHVSY